MKLKPGDWVCYKGRRQFGRICGTPIGVPLTKTGKNGRLTILVGWFGKFVSDPAKTRIWVEKDDLRKASPLEVLALQSDYETNAALNEVRRRRSSSSQQKGNQIA